MLQVDELAASSRIAEIVAGAAENAIEMGSGIFVPAPFVGEYKKRIGPSLVG
jgi:hypothetical protein